MRLDLLHGLRVLEQGDSVAVAFCGKILADLGADVLLLEPPGGSTLRRLPPNFEDRPGPSRSILYNWLCANKRSITLEVENDRGRGVLEELLRRADALVRVPAAGPSVTELHAVNPDLTVVTHLAVMSVDKNDGRLKVNKLMPGVTFEKVRESTEFKVEAASSMAQVPVHAPEELRILRDEVDPGREYLGKGD